MNIEDFNEPQILDDEIFPPVPHNSPTTTKNIHTYMYKKEQIMKCIQSLQKINDIKSKKTQKVLEKHLEKILEYEKKNIEFQIFENQMLITAKHDKNINPVLKNLYLY